MILPDNLMTRVTIHFILTLLTSNGISDSLEKFQMLKCIN